MRGSSAHVVKHLPIQRHEIGSRPEGRIRGKQLPGVLVVDRYGGYNKLPVKIQYCCAHLLRDVEKLERYCPEDEEVVRFAGGHTRSVLMSALHTLAKRRGDQSLEAVFKDILDKIAANQDVDLVPLILRPVADPRNLGVTLKIPFTFSYISFIVTQMFLFNISLLFKCLRICPLFNESSRIQ